MAQTRSNVKFRFSSFSSGVPEGFLGELQEGLAGGTPTADFFAGTLHPLHDLARHIAADGPSAWVESTDPASGLPVYTVTVGHARLDVRVELDPHVVGSDSTHYVQAGVATAIFTTGMGESDVIFTAIEKIGPTAAATITTGLLVLLVRPLLKSFCFFLRRFVEKAFDSAGTDAEAAAEEAAEEAAIEAAEEDVAVGEELAIDIAFTPLGVVGVVVALGILAVIVILLIIAKKMTLFVKVYNVTGHELELSLCHRYFADVALQPKRRELPPVGLPPHPPHVHPLHGQKVIYRADYVLVSANILKGVGFLLRAAPSAGFPGFDVAVGVPLVGANRLYVGLPPSRSCAWSFNDHAWNDPVLRASAGRDGYRLRIATNQLHGRSPSPATGEKGYYYEYLVVLDKP